MSLTYRALEDLTSQILQEVPGCPPNQVTLNLSRAVREFLQRTQIWKAKVSIPIDTLTTVYSFDTSEDIYIDEVCGVEIEGVGYLSDIELTGEIEFTVSSQFVSDHDGETMVLEAAVVPYSLPCAIPSRIVNRYSEFLKAGALSYIFGSVNRPYSNVQKADESVIKFRKGLRRGTRDAEAKNKRVSVNWGG